MNGGTLLWLCSSVVLLACLGLVVLIVGTKVVRTRRERRDAALVAPYRPLLLAVAAGEDDDGEALAALIEVGEPARTPLDNAVVDLLEKIRGVPTDQLASILLAHGAVDRAPHELRHRDTVRRARAAHVLGLCRVGAALPLLIAALEDRAPEVRVAAAQALGRIGEPTAAAALLRAVGAQHGVPAGPAADALEGMGVGISDALRDALVAASPTTRAVAAYLSGEGSFRRSLPFLRIVLATDDDLTVRSTAATALGRIGGREDVEVLLRHTRPDQPLDLRRTSCAALGELGDPSAAEELSVLAADPDPRLAELAAEALLHLGPSGSEALDDVPTNAATQTAQVLAGLRGQR